MSGRSVTESQHENIEAVLNGVEPLCQRIDVSLWVLGRSRITRYAESLRSSTNPISQAQYRAHCRRNMGNLHSLHNCRPCITAHRVM